MKTLDNILSYSGYNRTINNNNTTNNNSDSNGEDLSNPNIPKNNNNLGVLPNYEFMALNIISIFKKQQL